MALREDLNPGLTQSKAHSPYSGGDHYLHFTGEETEAQRDQEESQDSSCGGELDPVIPPLKASLCSLSLGHSKALHDLALPTSPWGDIRS